MDPSRRTMLQAAIAGLGVATLDSNPSAAQAKFTTEKTADFVLVKDAEGKTLARYIFGKVPAGETPPAVSYTDFTHPIWTPGGEVITDVGAKDHPHHRGIFFAWIQAEGVRNGDWWGWGVRAPKVGRTIVNRAMRVISADANSAVIEAVNMWKADDENILLETIRIRAHQARGHQLLDYTYHFAAAGPRDVTVGQQPFGGFCYRAKPRGEIIISDSSGALDRANSDPDVPAKNWPSKPWYDFSTKDQSGKIVGGAVFDHPSNPPTSWHIVRFAHMLNPCIVRDHMVMIDNKGLTLRYRVAAHDGGADIAALDALAADFRKS